MSDTTIIDWLLDSDPAIRWQALQDLQAKKGQVVTRERSKIASEGWGHRFLSLQDKTGRWAGGKSEDDGLYTPKWVSTTYTMLLLRDFGLPPDNRQAKKACSLLLDRGLRADGGISFGRWAEWTDRGETCITGMVLSILSYFRCDDARLDTITDHLLAQQMDDGGWNCRRPRGATHSSVHTTISALEGLRDYALHSRRKRKPVREAQERGQDFLLRHRLFRSHRTGAIINPAFLKLAYPPRWHYDILRALDYFRSVDAPRDERLAEAIELLRKKQLKDGSWPLESRYAGKVWFEMESLRKPSRWNTLRALRVLRWWEG